MVSVWKSRATKASGELTRRKGLSCINGRPSSAEWVEAPLSYFKPDLPIVGIGHSIGTVTLLALAGGGAQTLAGDTVISGSKLKFDRFALFAPPTDFFRRPGALKSVNVPIRIWVSSKDSITPPAQAQFLTQVLSLQGPIDICLDEEAGHFNYMDELPPNITDSHSNRSKFLASLANDVGRFVVA